MKRFFSVLILLAGLGSSISFSQVKQKTDPFDRYLVGIKVNRAEPALVRFAAECRVQIASLQPRFAVGPGSSVTPVKDLATGLRGLDTDFYSTAEVWVDKDRVLGEFWANSDDVGSEVRYLKCFADGKLTRAELIVWTVPLAQGPQAISWGYSRRWERSANGRMQRVKAEFVDEMEERIPKPRLDEDGQKGLSWIPPLGPLRELRLPLSMLR